MSKSATIIVSKLMIHTFGDNDQFCTHHDKETGEIKESCMYYNDCEMFCLVFNEPDQQNELDWDKENCEYLRHKDCLAAEAKW